VIKWPAFDLPLVFHPAATQARLGITPVGADWAIARRAGRSSRAAWQAMAVCKARAEIAGVWSCKPERGRSVL